MEKTIEDEILKLFDNQSNESKSINIIAHKIKRDYNFTSKYLQEMEERNILAKKSKGNLTFYYLKK